LDQKTISKHWHYRFDMPQTRSADLANILEFEGERAIGESSRYVIRFTHPQPDLSHIDYLNRPATLVIQTPFNPLTMLAPEHERRVQGLVTGFSYLSSSRDETTYEVVLESRLSLLGNVLKCRFFLSRSFPEIIEQILREHGFDQLRGSFEFNLYRKYRVHDFVMQWNEDDLTFITRLCRRSGIWFVCEEGDLCENVRFGDDFTHYRRDFDLKVPYREYSGLESSGAESVNSLEMNATTLPASYKVRTFSTENRLTQWIEASSEITEDRTTYGEAYTWGTPDLNESEAQEEALLRREAAIAAQVVYRGTCTVLDLAPSCILNFSNRELPDAKYGLLAVRVTCRASRKEPYHAEFTAIPTTLQLQLPRQYRLPLLESTWPRMEGVITGTIASPNVYKDPYVDNQGRYIVHLHADQDTRTPGLQSCPMRLAKPFAGAGQTGFHFGLVEGTIVTVGFLWGCPDLPFISQVLHTAQHTDPINSTYPWSTRNTLRTRSNNTLQMEDGYNREHIKLATEHGKSQLNLGLSVDSKQNERGRGAELRTDQQAIVRGGAGAMVTAYNRQGASGAQLDMQETIAQLKEMLALAQALAQSAEASKASPADTEAQKAINHALDKLKQPGVLVTAPGPVGVVSGDGVQLAADGSIVATAKKGVHFSTLKRFTVAARDLVSVFSQKGMSLIAAAGPVAVQAQRGSMQLAAQNDMTMETVDGVLHVKSSKEIVLNCGGTYLRMTPGGIEFGSRGGAVFKTSGLKKIDPAQMDLGGAAFAPKFVPYTTACEVWRTNANFVKEITPALAPAPVANTGAVAPAPDAGAAKLTPLTDLLPHAGRPDTKSSSMSPTATLTLNDPDNGQQICISPDPIQLQPAASCNWQLSDFAESATMERETPTYQKYGWTRTERLVKDGRPVMCAGTAPTTCQFTYDSGTKTLTAKVVTALIPRLLVKMNPKTREPMRDEHNNYVVVQYETFENGANSGKSFAEQGLMLVERDPKEVEASTYKNTIEKTLNLGNYRLILDGCQKGGACGCRVAVKFCADVHVVRAADAQAFNPNITINLYPTAERADAMNWPEKEYKLDNSGAGKVPHVTQTKAHETGHLFNFPDEYWEQGGFVHSMYVKDGRDINFTLADANKTVNKVWVIETENNLMGGGCIKPAATTSPYYLEYIRRWFSAQTNKLWRVGYNTPVVAAKNIDTSGGSSAANTGAAHATK
jgi:type VI secretion system secreted protein VgrG